LYVAGRFHQPLPLAAALVHLGEPDALEDRAPEAVEFEPQRLDIAGACSSPLLTSSTTSKRPVSARRSRMPVT